MLFYGGLRLPSILLLGLTLAIAPVRADDDDADAAGQTGAEVLTGYFAAVEAQRESLRGTSADVTFEGSLPRLKKHGRLSALRKISQIGQVTYKMLGFSGDDTVKKEVIARYMTAETTAKETASNVGINLENYQFKYKGFQDKQAFKVHVFELKPRAKRVGLFKGELWIDDATSLPVRESGRFVKNPSLFLKKVEFVREYEIVDGVARPKRIESNIDTRIAGKAMLAIDFTNYTREDAAAPAVAAESVPPVSAAYAEP